MNIKPSKSLDSVYPLLEQKFKVLERHDLIYGTIPVARRSQGFQTQRLPSIPELENEQEQEQDESRDVESPNSGQRLATSLKSVGLQASAPSQSTTTQFPSSSAK
eukprot:CAMPEP_0184700644 /NCGR_PEP_ID=MMETSP0313-20130426/14963_1 /TAXON_ID=2792 /ORGANISM="Porphyridium aerugineum, Strain SAG 1380-2" /LENGTH=104 /DNA_ID=CAMNT_0027160419 /DNA_START=187 /DNA_END=501 /DNA_ORIENTATION=-